MQCFDHYENAQSIIQRFAHYGIAHPLRGAIHSHLIANLNLCSHLLNRQPQVNKKVFDFERFAAPSLCEQMFGLRPASTRPVVRRLKTRTSTRCAIMARGSQPPTSSQINPSPLLFHQKADLIYVGSDHHF